MQAPFRKGWADTQVADHLRSGRIHLLQMEKNSQKRGASLRASGRNTDIAGRVHPQEEDNDSGFGQTRFDTVRSGSAAREIPARESGKGAEQGPCVRVFFKKKNFSLVRAPNAPVKTQVPDPLTEETMIRESTIGCQTDTTAKAESRLHPRYTQMKDARPFEGDVSDKSDGELSKQQRSSILSWNV